MDRPFNVYLPFVEEEWQAALASLPDTSLGISEAGNVVFDRVMGRLLSKVPTCRTCTYVDGMMRKTIKVYVHDDISDDDFMLLKMKFPLEFVPEP